MTVASEWVIGRLEAFIQRIEHLKITGCPAQQLLIARKFKQQRICHEPTMQHNPSQHYLLYKGLTPLHSPGLGRAGPGRSMTDSMPAGSTTIIMKPFEILLLFGFTCVPAQAQFNYTTDKGEITITRNCTDGAVVIPDTIDGLPKKALFGSSGHSNGISARAAGSWGVHKDR